MEAGPSRRDAGRSWLPWAGSSSASSPSSSSSPEAKTEPPPESAPSPFLAAQELKAPPKRIDFTIPSSVLVLTPTAAAVGLFIGMRRGGEKARLRFLAENVHRQPKTVQGWVSCYYLPLTTVLLHQNAQLPCPLRRDQGGREDRAQAGDSWRAVRSGRRRRRVAPRTLSRPDPHARGWAHAAESSARGMAQGPGALGGRGCSGECAGVGCRLTL